MPFDVPFGMGLPPMPQQEVDPVLEMVQRAMRANEYQRWSGRETPPTAGETAGNFLSEALPTAAMGFGMPAAQMFPRAAGAAAGLYGMLAPTDAGGAPKKQATAPAAPQSEAPLPPSDPRAVEIGKLNKSIAEQRTLMERAMLEQRTKSGREAVAGPYNQAISSLQTRLDKIQGQLDAESAKAAEAKQTWRQSNSGLAAAWPYIVPAAAAGVGALAKTGQRFSQWVSNRPWHKDVAATRRAISTNDPLAPSRITTLANRNANFPEGPAPDGNKLAMAAGAMTGAELGMVPMQLDIYNLGFSEAVKDPWELVKAGGTMAFGAGTGATAAKLMGALIPRSQPPIEASRALGSLATPEGRAQAATIRREMERMGLSAATPGAAPGGNAPLPPLAPLGLAPGPAPPPAPAGANPALSTASPAPGLAPGLPAPQAPAAQPSLPPPQSGLPLVRAGKTGRTYHLPNGDFAPKHLWPRGKQSSLPSPFGFDLA